MATPKNRSREELAMRDLIETWGRKRWPGSRCVHELVVGECRVDIAFINDSHLAVVEIKSSADTLARLEKQIRTFRRHCPEVWLAIAPRWADKDFTALMDATGYAQCHRITVDARSGALDQGYTHRSIDYTVTAPMLDLLWRDELLRVCKRTRCFMGNKGTMREFVDLLSRKMTGDEIVREVCRELRARHEGRIGIAFAKADAPIRLAV